jgi:hypothetical protein
MRPRNHAAHQAVTRVRRIWNELDYSQRRLFEVRTGVAVTGQSSRPRDHHSVQTLEDLYRRGWRR